MRRVLSEVVVRVSKYILKIALCSEPPDAQENLRLWRATLEADDKIAAINKMVCRHGLQPSRLI